MAKGEDKTNVMRLLEQAGIPYIPHYYDGAETQGTAIAATLGEDVDAVFKTLVTEAPDKSHFVFVIPVGDTLDLKKAARAAGVKSIVMIKQKELLGLTGYVHGGCSPVGMKKPFPTFIDETAILFDRFFVSAGRVGAQVELSPETLAGFIGAEFADVSSPG